jgi:hypothetical protein
VRPDMSCHNHDQLNTTSGSSRIGVNSEANTRQAISLFSSTLNALPHSRSTGILSRGRRIMSVKRVAASFRSTVPSAVRDRDVKSSFDAVLPLGREQEAALNCSQE